MGQGPGRVGIPPSQRAGLPWPWRSIRAHSQQVSWKGRSGRYFSQSSLLRGLPPTREGQGRDVVLPAGKKGRHVPEADDVVRARAGQQAFVAGIVRVDDSAGVSDDRRARGWPSGARLHSRTLPFWLAIASLVPSRSAAMPSTGLPWSETGGPRTTRGSAASRSSTTCSWPAVTSLPSPRTPARSPRRRTRCREVGAPCRPVWRAAVRWPCPRPGRRRPRPRSRGHRSRRRRRPSPRGNGR
jgi:hypothetical protein